MSARETLAAPADPGYVAVRPVLLVFGRPMWHR